MNNKLHRFNKIMPLLFFLIISHFFLFSKTETVKYNNYKIVSDTIIIKKIIEYDTNFVNKTITVRIKKKKIYYGDYDTKEAETKKTVLMEKTIPIVDFEKMMEKYGLEKTIEKIQHKINNTFNENNEQNNFLSKVKLSVNLPAIYFGTATNKFNINEKSQEKNYNSANNSSFDFALKSSIEAKVSSWIIELGITDSSLTQKTTNLNNNSLSFFASIGLKFDLTKKISLIPKLSIYNILRISKNDFIYDDEMNLSKINNSAINNWQLLYSASLKANYNLTKQLKIFIEPEVKLPATSYYKNSYFIKTKQSNIGVSFGVNYSF